jgi:hypothetical protein
MKPVSKTPLSTPAMRRNFLLGTAIAGAGAVAAVVAGGSATEILETASVDSKLDKPKGYHVTPHISQYYETTKL